MRTWVATVGFVVACGGGSEPRLIPGGGIGDGDIDGNVFVHVIDAATDEPVVGATVVLGGQTFFTNRKGFTEFTGVDGPQTIAVRMQGYRDAVWANGNGTNITIPISKAPEPVQMATIAGTISGWDPTVPAGHTKRAIIFDARPDEGVDAIVPGLGGCGAPSQTECSWAFAMKPGPAILIAAIIDDDNNVTQTVIGWAKTTIVVELDTAGIPINQTGIVLVPLDAGSVETLTIDFGAPPTALVNRSALIGIEITDDLVIQMPLIDRDMTMLVPKPSVIGPKATLRLTAEAFGQAGASVVLRRGLTGPTLAAGNWLTPPTGASATRTRAAWQPVAGATFYRVSYDTLDIAVFGATSVDVPSLVAPTSGISARIGAIGADIDPQNFSLRDADLFARAQTEVTF